MKPIIEISKTELADLYYSLPNKEVCRKLGISNNTLISYLKAAGIKTKGSGNRNKKNKIIIT